jgi:hypothetical protein
MKKLIQRFVFFPFFIQLVEMLCVLGVFLNLWLIGRDLVTGSVLFRLHLGYLILYAGQVVFILLREKYVCLLTLLQGLIALLTTVDFIFTPLLQIMGHLYYWLFSPSIESLKVYQYVFVSLGFTLQMASAAYLWGYFRIGMFYNDPCLNDK